MTLNKKTFMLALLLVTSISMTACKVTVTEDPIADDSTTENGSENTESGNNDQNTDTDNSGNNQDDSASTDNPGNDTSDGTTNDETGSGNNTDSNNDSTDTDSGQTDNDSNQDNGTENNTDTEDNSTDNETDSNNSETYPLWTSANVYTTGDRVSFNDVDYRASWWTQGSNPETSGEYGVWQQVTSETPNDNSTDVTDNNDTSNDSDTDGNTVETSPGPNTDKVIGSYFVEWGVYGRNYHVADIPAGKLTHVLYGFIPVCGNNTSLQQANAQGYSVLQQQCAGKPDYSVVVHDKYAALEKSYTGDKWDDPVKGNFGQLIKLKQQYPHLKVIPSIGGWTLSDPFYSMANNATNRAVFVNSVKDFLTTYSFFDGVDIDWEYPGGGGANTNLGSADDYQAYADLMRDLRTMLDAQEVTMNKTLELTSAIGAAPNKITKVNYADAVQYMDYIFAMTYDYYGAWNSQLGHLSGLYSNPSISVNDGFNVTDSINNMIAAGIPANKLVVGSTMYGRGWTGVQGQVNDPFAGQGSGTASAGTWEAGVLDYKAIESNHMGGVNGQGINGFSYYYDEIAEAAYLWNYTSGTLITFDDVRSTTAKSNYVNSNGLAGIFSWEIDADNGNILDAMSSALIQ
jgi:chitinase